MAEREDIAQEKTAARPYAAAVESTLPLVKKSAVTIITDTHLYVDEAHLYAIELAKETGRPLILESIRKPDYITIKQFEDGKISRPQFLALIKLGTDADIGHSAYIGKDRANAYHEKLADAIQSGVKILPGRLEYGITNDVPTMDRIGLLDVHITTDQMQFIEKNKEALVKDPKKFLKEYDREIAGKIDGMSREQREAYYNVANKIAGGHIRTNADAHAAIGDMFWAAHPASAEYRQLQRKLEKADKNFVLSVEGRLKDDKLLGEHLAETILENGGEAIVVYGTHHTAHEKKDGHDIDSVLREKGLATTVIDPTIPVGEIVSPTAREDIRKTGMSDYAKIHRAAAEEGGENRFSVDLRTGQVSSYAPVEKTSVLNQEAGPTGDGIIAKASDNYFSTAAECLIETDCGLRSNFSAAVSGQGLRVPEQKRTPEPSNYPDYTFG